MKRLIIFIPVVAFAVALLISSIAAAQTGAGYDLTWNTIDGGGGSNSGGTYSLAGTLGQSDAGTLSGSGYTLHGGFWISPAVLPLPHFEVFLPVVLR